MFMQKIAEAEDSQERSGHIPVKGSAAFLERARLMRFRASEAGKKLKDHAKRRLQEPKHQHQQGRNVSCKSIKANQNHRHLQRGEEETILKAHALNNV